MKQQRRAVYLACEEMDFTWGEEDVDWFVGMWQEGVPLLEIADKLDRCPDEVTILAIDQARKRRIHKRTGGVWGDSVRTANE